MNTQRILNTVRTLPRLDLIKTNDIIKSELLATRKDQQSRSYDSILIQYRKAKNIFQFFKEGLLNLYKARRDLNKEIFNGKTYIYDYGMGDSSGKLAIKWSDYDRILNTLAKRINLIEMERKAGKDIKSNDYGFNITRDQFAEMVQLKREWYKVPLFGFLFFVFDELSLPLIFLFPQMLPKTCILPGMIERRYYAKMKSAKIQLDQLSGGKSNELVSQVEDGTLSVWSLPPDQLKALCASLGIDGVWSRDRRMKLLRHIRELAVMRHMLKDNR